MFLTRFVQRISRNIGRRKAERLDAAFALLDHKDVFAKIYQKGVWGKKAGVQFFSGPGSHDQHVVAPYIESVRHLLLQFGDKPSVVDVGCGDFNVGQQLRPYCGKYIACDVVPDLIAHNVQKFKGMHVEFRCVDVVDDPIPRADFIFMRQVLQHLSNAMVANVLAKVSKSCRHFVLTEDIPLQDGFVPNRDKPTGPGTRTQFGSGVVVESAPFDFRFVTKQVICELLLENSRIRTTVFHFT